MANDLPVSGKTTSDGGIHGLPGPENISPVGNQPISANGAGQTGALTAPQPALSPDQWRNGVIAGGSEIRSSNGRYQAIFQTDGNLVVYDTSKSGEEAVLWASDTDDDAAGGHLAIQADGNLVIYAADSDAEWDTNTYSKTEPPSERAYNLVMQDDGNLVLYDELAHQPLWINGDRIARADDLSSGWGDIRALEYIASHPDLVDAFGTDADAARDHYNAVGLAEDRRFTFSAVNYLEANPDLAAAFGGDLEAATRHFIETGRHESRMLAPGEAPRTPDPVETITDPEGDGTGTVTIGGEAQNVEIIDLSSYLATGRGLAEFDDGRRILVERPEGAAHPEVDLGTSISSRHSPNILTNQYMTSQNGQYRAVFQSDGNFVVYDMAAEGGPQPIWDTGTNGDAEFGQVAMQSDGNLVIYRQGPSLPENAEWSSHTYNEGGEANRDFHMTLGDDGALLITDPERGGAVLWTSTGGHIEDASGIPEDAATTIRPNEQPHNPLNAAPVVLNGAVFNPEIPDGAEPSDYQDALMQLMSWYQTEFISAGQFEVYANDLPTLAGLQQIIEAGGGRLDVSDPLNLNLQQYADMSIADAQVALDRGFDLQTGPDAEQIAALNVLAKGHDTAFIELLMTWTSNVHPDVNLEFNNRSSRARNKGDFRLTLGEGQEPTPFTNWLGGMFKAHEMRGKGGYGKDSDGDKGNPTDAWQVVRPDLGTTQAVSTDAEFDAILQAVFQDGDPTTVTDPAASHLSYNATIVDREDGAQIFDVDRNKGHALFHAFGSGMARQALNIFAPDAVGATTTFLINAQGETVENVSNIGNMAIIEDGGGNNVFTTDAGDVTFSSRGATDSIMRPGTGDLYAVVDSTSYLNIEDREAGIDTSPLAEGADAVPNGEGEASSLNIVNYTGETTGNFIHSDDGRNEVNFAEGTARGFRLEADGRITVNVLGGAEVDSSVFVFDDTDGTFITEAGSKLSYSTIFGGDGEDTLMFNGENVGNYIRTGDGNDYIEIGEDFRGDFDVRDSASSWMWANDDEIFENDTIVIRGLAQNPDGTTPTMSDRMQAEGWTLVDGNKLVSYDEDGSILAQINLSGDAEDIENIIVSDGDGGVTTLQEVPPEVKTKLAALGFISQALMVVGAFFPPAAIAGAVTQFVYDAANDNLSFQSAIMTAASVAGAGGGIGGVGGGNAIAPAWVSPALQGTGAALSGDWKNFGKNLFLTTAGMQAQNIMGLGNVPVNFAKISDGVEAALITVDGLDEGSAFKVAEGVFLLGTAVGVDGSTQLLLGGADVARIGQAIDSGELDAILAATASFVSNQGIFNEAAKQIGGTPLLEPNDRNYVAGFLTGASTIVGFAETLNHGDGIGQALVDAFTGSMTTAEYFTGTNPVQVFFADLEGEVHGRNPYGQNEQVIVVYEDNPDADMPVPVAIADQNGDENGRVEQAADGSYNYYLRDADGSEQFAFNHTPGSDEFPSEVRAQTQSEIESEDQASAVPDLGNAPVASTERGGVPLEQLGITQAEYDALNDQQRLIFDTLISVRGDAAIFLNGRSLISPVLGHLQTLSPSQMDSFINDTLTVNTFGGLDNIPNADFENAGTDFLGLVWEHSSAEQRAAIGASIERKYENGTLTPEQIASFASPVSYTTDEGLLSDGPPPGRLQLSEIIEQIDNPNLTADYRYASDGNFARMYDQANARHGVDLHEFAALPDYAQIGLVLGDEEFIQQAALIDDPQTMDMIANYVILQTAKASPQRFWEAVKENPGRFISQAAIEELLEKVIPGMDLIEFGQLGVNIVGGTINLNGQVQAYHDAETPEERVAALRGIVGSTTQAIDPATGFVATSGGFRAVNLGGNAVFQGYQAVTGQKSTINNADLEGDTTTGNAAEPQLLPDGTPLAPGESIVEADARVGDVEGTFYTDDWGNLIFTYVNQDGVRDFMNLDDADLESGRTLVANEFTIDVDSRPDTDADTTVNASERAEPTVEPVTSVSGAEGSITVTSENDPVVVSYIGEDGAEHQFELAAGTTSAQADEVFEYRYLRGDLEGLTPTYNGTLTLSDGVAVEVITVDEKVMARVNGEITEIGTFDDIAEANDAIREHRNAGTLAGAGVAETASSRVYSPEWAADREFHIEVLAPENAANGTGHFQATYEIGGQTHVIDLPADGVVTIADAEAAVQAQLDQEQLDGLNRIPETEPQPESSVDIPSETPEPELGGGGDGNDGGTPRNTATGGTDGDGNDGNDDDPFDIPLRNEDGTPVNPELDADFENTELPTPDAAKPFFPQVDNAKDYFTILTGEQVANEFRERNGLEGRFDNWHETFAHLLQPANEVSYEMHFTNLVDDVFGQVSERMLPSFTVHQDNGQGLSPQQLSENREVQAQAERDQAPVTPEEIREFAEQQARAYDEDLWSRFPGGTVEENRETAVNYLIDNINRMAELNGVEPYQFIDLASNAELTEGLLLVRPTSQPLSTGVPIPEDPQASDLVDYDPIVPWSNINRPAEPEADTQPTPEDGGAGNDGGNTPPVSTGGSDEGEGSQENSDATNETENSSGEPDGNGPDQSQLDFETAVLGAPATEADFAEIETRTLEEWKTLLQENDLAESSGHDRRRLAEYRIDDMFIRVRKFSSAHLDALKAFDDLGIGIPQRGQLVSTPDAAGFSTGIVATDFIEGINLSYQLEADRSGSIQIDRDAWADAVVEMVATMHNGGWLHNDLRADQIMGDPSAPFLIDLETADRIDSPTEGRQETSWDMAGLHRILMELRDGDQEQVESDLESYYEQLSPDLRADAPQQLQIGLENLEVVEAEILSEIEFAPQFLGLFGPVGDGVDARFSDWAKSTLEQFALVRYSNAPLTPNRLALEAERVAGREEYASVFETPEDLASGISFLEANLFQNAERLDMDMWTFMGALQNSGSSDLSITQFGEFPAFLAENQDGTPVDEGSSETNPTPGQEPSTRPLDVLSEGLDAFPEPSPENNRFGLRRIDLVEYVVERISKRSLGKGVKVDVGAPVSNEQIRARLETLVGSRSSSLFANESAEDQAAVVDQLMGDFERLTDLNGLETWELIDKLADPTESGLITSSQDAVDDRPSSNEEPGATDQNSDPTDITSQRDYPDIHNTLGGSGGGNTNPVVRPEEWRNVAGLSEDNVERLEGLFYVGNRRISDPYQRKAIAERVADGENPAAAALDAVMRNATARSPHVTDELLEVVEATERNAGVTDPGQIKYSVRLPGFPPDANYSALSEGYVQVITQDLESTIARGEAPLTFSRISRDVGAMRVAQNAYLGTGNPRGRYGELRQGGNTPTPQTPITERYEPYRERIRRYAETVSPYVANSSVGGIAEVSGAEYGITKLSQLSVTPATQSGGTPANQNGRDVMFYATGSIDLDAGIAALDRLFVEAQQAAPEDAVAKIAEFAWVFYQVAPYVNGTAAIGQWLTTSLLNIHGGDYTAVRPGIALDLEAFAQSKDSFIENFPTFFEGFEGPASQSGTTPVQPDPNTSGPGPADTPGQSNDPAEQPTDTSGQTDEVAEQREVPSETAGSSAIVFAEDQIIPENPFLLPPRPGDIFVIDPSEVLPTDGPGQTTPSEQTRPNPFERIFRGLGEGVSAGQDAVTGFVDRFGADLLNSPLFDWARRRRLGAAAEENSLRIEYDDQGNATIDITAREPDLLDAIIDSNRDIAFSLNSSFSDPTGLAQIASAGISVSPATLGSLRADWPQLQRAVADGSMSRVREIFAKAFGITGSLAQGLTDPRPMDSVLGQLNIDIRTGGFLQFNVSTLEESDAFRELPNGGWELTGRRINASELADGRRDMAGRPARETDYVLEHDLPLDAAATQLFGGPVAGTSLFSRTSLEAADLNLTIPAGTPIPATVYERINGRLRLGVNVSLFSGPGSAYEGGQRIVVATSDPVASGAARSSDDVRFDRDFIGETVLHLNGRTDLAELYTGDLDEAGTLIVGGGMAIPIPGVGGISAGITIVRGSDVEADPDEVTPMSVEMEFTSASSDQVISVTDPERIAVMRVQDDNTLLELGSVNVRDVFSLPPVEGATSTPGISVMAIDLGPDGNTGAPLIDEATGQPVIDETGEPVIDEATQGRIYEKTLVPTSLLDLMHGEPLTVKSRIELAGFLLLYRDINDPAVSQAITEVWPLIESSILNEPLTPDVSSGIGKVIRRAAERGLLPTIPLEIFGNGTNESDRPSNGTPSGEEAPEEGASAISRNSAGELIQPDTLRITDMRDHDGGFGDTAIAAALNLDAPTSRISTDQVAIANHLYKSKEGKELRNLSDRVYSHPDQAEQRAAVVIRDFMNTLPGDTRHEISVIVISDAEGYRIRPVINIGTDGSVGIEGADIATAPGPDGTPYFSVVHFHPWIGVPNAGIDFNAGLSVGDYNAAVERQHRIAHNLKRPVEDVQVSTVSIDGATGTTTKINVQTGELSILGVTGLMPNQVTQQTPIMERGSVTDLADYISPEIERLVGLDRSNASAEDIWLYDNLNVAFLVPNEVDPNLPFDQYAEAVMRERNASGDQSRPLGEAQVNAIFDSLKMTRPEDTDAEIFQLVVDVENNGLSETEFYQALDREITQFETDTLDILTSGRLTPDAAAERIDFLERIKDLSDFLTGPRQTPRSAIASWMQELMEKASTTGGLNEVERVEYAALTEALLGDTEDPAYHREVIEGSSIQDPLLGNDLSRLPDFQNPAVFDFFRNLDPQVASTFGRLIAGQPLTQPEVSAMRDLLNDIVRRIVNPAGGLPPLADLTVRQIESLQDTISIILSVAETNGGSLDPFQASILRSSIAAVSGAISPLTAGNVPGTTQQENSPLDHTGSDPAENGPSEGAPDNRPDVDAILEELGIDDPALQAEARALTQNGTFNEEDLRDFLLKAEPGTLRTDDPDVIPRLGVETDQTTIGEMRDITAAALNSGRLQNVGIATNLSIGFLASRDSVLADIVQQSFDVHQHGGGTICLDCNSTALGALSQAFGGGSYSDGNRGSSFANLIEVTARAGNLAEGTRTFIFNVPQSVDSPPEGVGAIPYYLYSAPDSGAIYTGGSRGTQSFNPKTPLEITPVYPDWSDPEAPTLFFPAIFSRDDPSQMVRPPMSIPLADMPQLVAQSQNSPDGLNLETLTTYILPSQVPYMGMAGFERDLKSIYQLFHDVGDDNAAGLSRINLGLVSGDPVKANAYESFEVAVSWVQHFEEQTGYELGGIGLGETTIAKEGVIPFLTDTIDLANPEHMARIKDYIGSVGEAGAAIVLHADIGATPSAVAYQSNPDGTYVLDDNGNRIPLSAIMTTAESDNANYDHIREVASVTESPLIWAHFGGIGRTQKPTFEHLAKIRDILEDPALDHVYIDLSWDIVSSYFVGNTALASSAADLIKEFPDRFLYGSDTVAGDGSKHQALEDYLQAGVFDKLTVDEFAQVMYGNALDLFDQASVDVRAWMDANRDRLQELRLNNSIVTEDEAIEIMLEQRSNPGETPNP